MNGSGTAAGAEIFLLACHVAVNAIPALFFFYRVYIAVS